MKSSFFVHTQKKSAPGKKPFAINQGRKNSHISKTPNGPPNELFRSGSYAIETFDRH